MFVKREQGRFDARPPSFIIQSSCQDSMRAKNDSPAYTSFLGKLVK